MIEKLRGRGRPRKDEETTAFVIHTRVGGQMLDRLTSEWHRRGLSTRADTVRALLAEALGMK